MMRRPKISFANTLARLAWALIYKGRQGRGRIPVRCYHRVLPGLMEDVNDPLYTILPEQFESQMAFLAHKGFQSLSLSEFAEVLQGARTFQEREVVVTFDDGYADTYEIAWPLAQKYGIKLNLFVCTGLIGEKAPAIMTKNGYQLLEETSAGAGIKAAWRAHLLAHPQLWRPLTWQQLAKMRTSGVGIGLHSHSHRNLASLGPVQVAEELQLGLAMLWENLHYRPECLALPYGGYGAMPHNIQEITRNLGISFVFTTVYGRAILPSSSCLIPRLEIYQQDTLASFQHKLWGAFDWLGPVQYLGYLLQSVHF